MNEHRDAREALELAAAEPGGLDRLEAGDTAEAIAVAGHLAGCPDCLEELARLRRAETLLRPVIASEPDPALRERTLALIREVGVQRGARPRPAPPPRGRGRRGAAAPRTRRRPGRPATVVAAGRAMAATLASAWRRTLLAGAAPWGNATRHRPAASARDRTLLATGDPARGPRDASGTPAGRWSSRPRPTDGGSASGSRPRGGGPCWSRSAVSAPRSHEWWAGASPGGEWREPRRCGRGVGYGAPRRDRVGPGPSAHGRL